MTDREPEGNGVEPGVSTASTARLLHCHRTTVLYQIARNAEVTGEGRASRGTERTPPCVTSCLAAQAGGTTT